MAIVSFCGKFLFVCDRAYRMWIIKERKLNCLILRMSDTIYSMPYIRTVRVELLVYVVHTMTTLYIIVYYATIISNVIFPEYLQQRVSLKRLHREATNPASTCTTRISSAAAPTRLWHDDAAAKRWRTRSSDSDVPMILSKPTYRGACEIT